MTLRSTRLAEALRSPHAAAISVLVVVAFLSAALVNDGLGDTFRASLLFAAMLLAAVVITARLTRPDGAMWRVAIAPPAVMCLGLILTLQMNIVVLTLLPGLSEIDRIGMTVVLSITTVACILATILFHVLGHTKSKPSPARL